MWTTAPGMYCPEKVNFDKGPCYSLFGKPHPEKPDDLPGNKILITKICLNI